MSECSHPTQHHGVCTVCGEEPKDTVPLEELDEALVRIRELEAELRQYQPSDGMMVKLLGLDDVIREAARLLFDSGSVKRDMPEHLDAVDAWMCHPTVDRAVKSAMARAKVKP
jgi:hypothetical protein